MKYSYGILFSLLPLMVAASSFDGGKVHGLVARQDDKKDPSPPVKDDHSMAFVAT